MPYKNPDEQRKFQRVWIADRRAAHFKGKKCAKCGKNVTSHTADLDHKKPKRNRDGSKIWSKTKAKRTKEIKKTQILCKACHKKKTARDLHNMAENAQKLFLEMVLQADGKDTYAVYSAYSEIAGFIKSSLSDKLYELENEEADFISCMSEVDKLPLD